MTFFAESGEFLKSALKSVLNQWNGLKVIEINLAVTYYIDSSFPVKVKHVSLGSAGLELETSRSRGGSFAAVLIWPPLPPPPRHPPQASAQSEDAVTVR